MQHETIVILGIPIDNVTMDQAVERILEMIDTFSADRMPRLVATVNVDFLVNTLAWFSKHPRHPELLNILRQAHLITADGMPIVWLSRLLGNPLKERVTGADLVPKLAQAASSKGKSIYFLGGMGEVGNRAAEILKHHYPELIIAGVDAPFVTTIGEQLVDAGDQDAQIIQRINRSNADVLLIAFGNPKQEVWFERNRAFLKVPVTIGIGGTFEFIAGSVARAPVWMQKTGLEWIFRFTQDPKRLWKRYVIGLFKFGLMVLPVVGYYCYRRFVFSHLHRKKSGKESVATVGSAGALKVRRVSIEDPLDAAMVITLNDELNAISAMADDTAIIFDLSRVTFMDSSGIGFLLRHWNKAKEAQKMLYLTGIQPSVEKTLQISRIHDLFEGHILATTDEAVGKIVAANNSPEFQMVISQTNQCLLLHFSGTLDASQALRLDMEELLTMLAGRHLALDLNGLSFVDSSGLMIFLKLHRHVVNHDRSCWVSGAGASVRQMFRITKIDRLFEIVPDVHAIVTHMDNN